MSTMPTERGIVSLTLDIMESVLLDEMKTKIAVDDVSRLSHVQVGPPQHSPHAVAIYLYENELGVNVGWRHSPDGRDPTENYRGQRDARPAGRVPLGRLNVGGDGLYQRAFTMQIIVTGNKMDLGATEVTPSIVGDVAGIVAGRAVKALTSRYESFTMAAADSFGEKIAFGPYWGEEWNQQQEGQALRIIKFLQVWFRTSREFFS